MHTDFADWYRIAGIEPDAALLTNRWSGIEKVLATIDGASVLELVRLYYGRALSDESFLERFRLPFKETDSTFPMRSNDLELKVLAASTLMALLEDRPRELCDLAALCIKSAEFRGQVKPQVLQDLIASAKRYLRSRSLDVRSIGGKLPSQRPKKLSVETLAQKCTGSELSILVEPMTELINGMNSSFEGMASSMQKAMNALHTAQEVQQEELDILWWVFGEYSGDMERKMSQLSVPAACLVAAKELADHTTRLPGVPSAEAFLDKVLRGVRKRLPATVTVKDAVNDVDRKWRESHAGLHPNLPIDAFAPVHRAIVNSLETAGDVEWVPAYETATGLAADRPVAPLALGSQFYDEVILARVVEGSSG